MGLQIGRLVQQGLYSLSAFHYLWHSRPIDTVQKQWLHIVHSHSSCNRAFLRLSCICSVTSSSMGADSAENPVLHSVKSSTAPRDHVARLVNRVLSVDCWLKALLQF
eukprot:5461802-Amphidinium_carterae.1